MARTSLINAKWRQLASVLVFKAGSDQVTITINGGTVNATCTQNKDNFGAAIGTGANAEGPASITINGGTITAIGVTAGGAGDGAAIGTGDTYKSTSNTEIKITGGTIYAYACNNGGDESGFGAGIGMGDDWSSGKGKANITITGGTIKAYSGYWCGYGSGIGGG